MSPLTRRNVLRSTGVGTAVSLAGCSSLTAEFTASETPTSTPKEPPDPDYVRPCDERISGQFTPGHESHIDVGPLTFALVLNYMPTFDDFTPGGTSVKARVVVQPEAVVTLVVPEREREDVALNYNWNDRYRNGDPLEDAQRSVRFAACGSDSPRQYNGGVVVTGPRCVVLEVWVQGENAPREVRPPVGTECER